MQSKGFRGHTVLVHFLPHLSLYLDLSLHWTTMMIMTRFLQTTTTIFTILYSTIAWSQPFFNQGNDPKPIGKYWALLPNLSDEFNGSAVDLTKWNNTDDGRWKGRAPGRFKADAATVSDGELNLACYKLDVPEENGTWTHAGALIGGKHAAYPGQYFETRVKANKTFMSTTFWLINNRGDGTGCDRRVTELDIQECVGITTSSDPKYNWADNVMDTKMNSNTHSRQGDCPETNNPSKGNKADLENGKPHEGYHVYGAWWKSDTEVLFFLDGKHVGTVTPPYNFNLPMYLRMVVETYDWNPPLEGADGMTDTQENRTSHYQWVRSWELVEEDPNADQVAPVGKRIGLRKAGGDMQFLTLNSETNKLSATGGIVSENLPDASLFDVIAQPVGGNIVSIVSALNGKFSSIPQGASIPLSIDEQTIDAAAQFEWIDLGDNIIALKSLYDGNYLSASWDDDGASILSNSATRGDWQTFEVVNLGETPLPASIDDFERNNNITIAPNPTTDIISAYIKLDQTQQINISVYNLSGTLMHQETRRLRNGVNQVTINTANLGIAKGIYFLKVEGSSFSKLERVIIN